MKKKLIASAVSLAMALVMLTSASFAWFTVSTAPEITSIKVQMGTSKNLEIANITATNKTDGPSEVALGDSATGTGTWGATATFANAAAGIQFPVTGIDSSTKKVQTITFDDTGRVNAGTNVQALTLTDGTMADDGTNTATATVNIGGSKTASYVVASSYTVWLRSNVDQAAISAALGEGTFTFAGFVNGNGNANAADNKMTNSDVIVALKDSSGNFTALTSTAADTGIKLTKNTATKVTVYVLVKGDNIVAADMNHAGTAEDPYPSVSGIKVNFSSNDVPAPAAPAAPTPAG